MNAFEDRLSRVAALRPRARMPALPSVPETSSNSERLIQLLGGESHTNSFGSHICVRRRFPQPQPAEMSSRALRLIAPNSSDSICDTRQWLFLDTETTGLAGGTGTYAFLVGACLVGGRGVHRRAILHAGSWRRTLASARGFGASGPAARAGHFQRQELRLAAPADPFSNDARASQSRNHWRIWICSIRLARSGA